MDELRVIENRWRTWAACLHEAGHLVAAIAGGHNVTGAFILSPTQAYSRCEASPVVFAAGDMAVKLRAMLGTQPPEGAPQYFDNFMPEILVSDDAGTRQGLYPPSGTPDAPSTPAPTIHEITAEAEIILRKNWLALVEIASALYLRGHVTGSDARGFMGGL